jgi:glycosyltransferase involved in cell wall biosynthesis
MKTLFVLPGFHLYDRGAETALISVATELVKRGDTVTLIGAGPYRPGATYRYLKAGAIRRENFEGFPALPPFRNECVYEELTFIPGLLRQYHPHDYDVTITCSYPFTNWILRRPTFGRARPHHVYITQNGDWPAYSNNSEFRFFGCDGLVCTNPDFYQRNQNKWRCQLIPNGIDIDRFTLGAGSKQSFGLPENKLIVLMVSALIPSKRVQIGIEALKNLPDAHLVVAGDGPLRETIDAAANELLPGRFTRLNVASENMPTLYKSADVFLHLSKDESFGNVFLEAMASGLPIVGHDTPRLRWIVGDDEYLLDTDNIAEIATKIVYANHEPISNRKERAKKAIAFSWARIGGMYRDFLHKIAACPKKY